MTLKPLLARALVLGFGLVLSGAQATAASPAPSHEVTAGQLQYNYEALLQHLFGAVPQQCRTLTVPVNGVATTVHNWWLGPPFPKGQDLSMGNCTAYIFTFAHLGPSSFHLEPSWFAVNYQDVFGANDFPVLINQRYVACEPSGTELLNSWTAVSGAVLGCTPLPR
jgi:hypothetical protein